MDIPIVETKILYRKLLRNIKPDVIFDIGSCDGNESIKAAKISPKSTVVAFEANPYNFKEIIDNPKIRENNIKVHNTAIQNEDSNILFNVIDSELTNNKGTSSLLIMTQIHAKQVEVSGSRLDSFVNYHYPESKTVSLWIDVEGAGYQVLEGIKSIRDRIVFFQIEVEENQIWEGQRTKSDIIEIANVHGFRPIARGEGSNQFDLIFVNKRKENTFDLQGILKSAIWISRIRRCFEILREFKRRYIFKS